jgi:SNF2 family DNA or RNA helicase
MVSKLHDILKPFLLRRVKSDVETSLPPKREIVLYAPLTSNQLEIEKKLVNKTLISEIQEQLASKSGRSTVLCTVFRPLLHCNPFCHLKIHMLLFTSSFNIVALPIQLTVHTHAQKRQPH